MTFVMYLLLCTKKDDYQHLPGSAERQRGSFQSRPRATRGRAAKNMPVDILPSPDLKAVLLALKHGYTRRELEGVIVVQDHRKSIFHSGAAMGIVYSESISDSARKKKNDNDTNDDDDERTICIEFIQAKSQGLRQARLFLGDRTCEQLPLDRTVYERCRKTLLPHAQPKRNVDVTTGCIVYEGILPRRER